MSDVNELAAAAIKIKGLADEVEESLRQRKCTLDDALLLTAYLYIQVETVYRVRFPDDKGPQRFLAVRFAQYVESARESFT